jgi:predicted nucleotidyltransferase component of viral defense system
MLTRAQIQRLAQRHNIGVQAQERDYLQHLLLLLLYNHSQALLFKGGTALRVVYRGGRYSEDLDFNGTIEVDEIKKLWIIVLRDLAGFGIKAEGRYEWLSHTGFSFDVSYQGPLFDGRDGTKGKVRIDISLRSEEVDIERKLIASEYDDINPFVITVLAREHLMAEKVRALILRGKARDVYDLWLLASQGIRLDPNLVAKKLAFTGTNLSPQMLNDALSKAGQDWERDLQPLLPQFIPWEDAIREVRPILAELL